MSDTQEKQGWSQNQEPLQLPPLQSVVTSTPDLDIQTPRPLQPRPPPPGHVQYPYSMGTPSSVSHNVQALGTEEAGGTGTTSPARVPSRAYARLASSSSRENVGLPESVGPSSRFEDHQPQAERPFEVKDRFRSGVRETDTQGRRESRRPLSQYDGPLPPLPRIGSDIPVLRRVRTAETQLPAAALSRRRSEIDWIVPVEEKSLVRSRTVAERLQPTFDIAKETRDKFARKAKYTGYVLNAAIGLQVLLGSLTTGLSAVATTGRQLAVQTTILGGLTTIVAGYLARARGSNEPELSTSRVKDLDKYIREGTAFLLDFGHLDGIDYNERIEEFRREFEELLGNGSGERKLAPTV